MTGKNLFLEIAREIGHRIVQQARWREDVCTWMIMSRDHAHPDSLSATPKLASGEIYQGTAGIALFLIELFEHVQDKRLRETAEGAIQHSLSEGQDLPENSFGFYNGRVGIAYASAKIGRCLNQQKYLDQAADLLVPLEGKEDQDERLDVIAGAAGAIPALLQLATWLDTERPARMAIALGESLIQQSFYEPTGWSWDTLNSTNSVAKRHLTGYAHGASGIGHCFLELYRVTEADRYRYAAEQALLYERQFFDEEESNWPDFRCAEFSKYLRAGGKENLRAEIKDGDNTCQETYRSLWCHGAPGIGLVRLRAYDLLDREVYAHEASAALESVKTSRDPFWTYSLCHGVGGTCETLLYAAHVLGKPELRSQAEAYGEQGKKYAEDDSLPWPCGLRATSVPEGAEMESQVETSEEGKNHAEDDPPPWPYGTVNSMNTVSDPSLMLGEAGIGYFYLRLFSAETPSCLFLRAPGGLNLTKQGITEENDLRQEYVEAYFGPTIERLSALDVEFSANTRSLGEKSVRYSDVQKFKNRLTDFFARSDSPVETLVRDASRLDRIRYEMQKNIDDFTGEMIKFFRRPSPEDISWETASFERAPHTQIVEQKWAWKEWLSTPDPERSEKPEEDRSVYLLYRSENWIHAEQIGPFMELILRSLDAPASASDIAQSLRRRANLGDVPQQALHRRIVDQLSQAYEAGIVHYSH